MTLSELTQGEWMFYGGIAGAVALVLLSIMLIIVFHKKKKKLLKRIEEDF